MQPTNKLYVVRVFNDKRLPDRFYDEYFFNEYEANRFYRWIKEQGFEAVKPKEENNVNT